MRWNEMHDFGKCGHFFPLSFYCLGLDGIPTFGMACHFVSDGYRAKPSPISRWPTVDHQGPSPFVRSFFFAASLGEGSNFLSRISSWNSLACCRNLVRTCHFCSCGTHRTRCSMSKQSNFMLDRSSANWFRSLLSQSFFFRPTPTGFRLVVQHVQLHVAKNTESWINAKSPAKLWFKR